MQKYIFITSLCVLLSACSQHDKRPDKPSTKEAFSTQVTDDGSKMFAYTLNAQRPDKDRASRPGTPPEGRRDGGRRSHESKGSASRPSKADMNEKLLAQVDKTLLDKGYCREGYITLDQRVIRGQFSLRGECKETASEQDRLDFPNN